MKAAGLVLLAWLLIGFGYARWGYDLPVIPKVVEGSERWELPEWQPIDIETPLLYMKEMLPWGAPPPPPGVVAPVPVEVPMTEPEWRILSAVTSTSGAFVSVQVGKDPITEIRVGGALPDGSTIERIENDRLYLKVKGKKRILRLYPE